MSCGEVASRPAWRCAGDAHISVGQLLRLAGAVIVTTPQDLALMDARRGVTLFRTMKARHDASEPQALTSGRYATQQSN